MNLFRRHKCHIYYVTTPVQYVRLHDTVCTEQPFDIYDRGTRKKAVRFVSQVSRP